MTREVRMDGQFIVFSLALGVPLVFGACIGAAFRRDVPAGDCGSSLLRSGLPVCSAAL